MGSVVACILCIRPDLSSKPVQKEEAIVSSFNLDKQSHSWNKIHYIKNPKADVFYYYNPVNMQKFYSVRIKGVEFPFLTLSEACEMGNRNY